MTDSARHCIALLESLRASHPYLIPEITLFAETNLRLGQPITHTAFRELLAELEQARSIVSHTDSLTKAAKWKATDNGLARLAELR